jgi:hypothetical protein
MAGSYTFKIVIDLTGTALLLTNMDFIRTLRLDLMVGYTQDSVVLMKTPKQSYNETFEGQLFHVQKQLSFLRPFSYVPHSNCQ